MERIWIRSSEPIFPVADVVATVRYYRDVLGFAEEWVWGAPPDFGGVRWGKVGAMFALQSGPDCAGRRAMAFILRRGDRLPLPSPQSQRCYDLLAPGGEALGPA